MSRREPISASINSELQINADELLKMLPNTNKKRAILNEIDSNTMLSEEQKKTTLKRSRSNPSLFTKDSLKPVEKPRMKTSNKVKTPVRDRTPITPFLTPQNVHRREERTPTNHFHSSNHGTPTSLFSRTAEKNSRTPLKRFLSEMNLPKPMATPECFNKVSLETPRVCRESDDYRAESSPIIVGVRVRPMNSREMLEPQISNAVTLNGNDVLVTCESGTSHKFTYDHCFTSTNPNHDEYANQEDIFTIMMQPLIDKIFEGYNACLFAYGQTGSGKTYSMLGEEIEIEEMGLSKGSGIIPRFCYELFERISSYSDIDINLTPSSRPKIEFEFKVEVSYFEIYNEKIHDLLDKSTEAKKTPLKVREHPLFGPYVVDLSTHIVNSFEEMLSWLKIGINQRMTAPTNMNEKSSRSHSIFSVILSQNQITEDKANYTKRSKINLIDLAGSERVSQMSSSCRERIREGVSINRSLLTLGKVIAALSENSHSRKKSHVPYRDSVLTWLLRESLGGNSRTSLLATISPTNLHLDETLATLRYACQARDIVNHVRVTEDPNQRMIRDLKTEVEDLRAQNDNLKHQLTVKLKSPSTPSRNEDFPDSPSQSHKINNLHSMTCASEIIQCEGLSVRLNLLNGCWLVNLGADPASSGLILYRLPEGQIIVSREPVEDSQSQIILNGPSVHHQHCLISNDSGNLSVQPLSGDTWVNAKVIQEETQLHHGDRLVIGDHHYFRISMKHELQTNSENSSQPLADLAFAKEEIFSEIKNTYENKISTAELRISELEKDKIIYEKKISNAEMRINQLENDNINYKNKISSAGTKIDDLERENLNYENKISTAELKINDLEKDNLKYENLISSTQLRINELEKENLNYENQISTAEMRITELENDNSSHEDTISTAEMRINELEKDNKDYLNNLEMQRTSYETQIKKLTSLMEEQNSQLSSIQTQNKELISECEMLKEELDIKSQKETFDILNLSIPSYQSNFIEQIEAEFQTWFEEFIPLAKRFENEIEMKQLVLKAQQVIMDSNILLDISLQSYNEEIHVKMLDKNSGKTIYMKLERFRTWLQHFQESPIHSIKELFESDISFEPRFCSSVLSAHDSDELMLSRISNLNQSSPIQNSLSSCRYSENSMDYSIRKSSESEANISYSQMRIHVEKLEAISRSLMFCSCSKKIESIISSLMETVDNLKSALEDQLHSSEEYTTITSVSELSMPDSSLVLIPPTDIPKKSNLKAPYIHSSPNKKAVRFKFTQSQLES